MIRYRFGDLFELLKNDNMNMFAHGCNCFNTMGSGFALQVKEKYPSLYDADCKTESGDLVKLGTFSHDTMEDGVTGFNLYTQFKYSKKSPSLDLSAVEHSFKALTEYLISIKRQNEILLIPKIGGGLAQGDWFEIIRTIDRVTHPLNIIVVLGKDNVPN